MKKIFLRFTYLLSALILVSCSSSQQSSNSRISKGDYTFTMYDSTEKIIMSGNMTVNNIVDMEISGTYNITNLVQKNFEAIGVMEGKFSGTMEKNTSAVFINTNPMIADANVFFNLRYDYTEAKFVGEWRFSVFRRDAEPLKGRVTLVRHHDN
jgi:hypothetical protein